MRGLLNFEKGECLYVIRFTNHPNLLKIGISKNVNNRISQLKQDHGEVTSISAYYGNNSKYVERILHNTFGDKRVKVVGQGGTEFFKDTLSLEVLELTCVSCGLVLKSPKVKNKRKMNTKVSKVLNGYNTSFRPLYIEHLLNCIKNLKGCYVENGNVRWNVKMINSNCLEFSSDHMCKTVDINVNEDLIWLNLNCNIVDFWNENL